MNDGLSFERDLKPLFRERDRATMMSVANFDLCKRDDVADNSQAILTRLEEGSMPGDVPVGTDPAWLSQMGCQVVPAPAASRRSLARS